MRLRGLVVVGLLSASAAFAPLPRADELSPYAAKAKEVTDHIQATFYDPKSGVYLKALTIQKPDYVWLQSVEFANLVAAARSQPKTYRPILEKYFAALDSYWDAKVKIPGYEPAPTRGNGDDKYYDDNAWLVITFLEAYETNRSPRYFARAANTLKFVLSGWDNEAGGGIWWHQSHKDGTKNTCANGPAAVGCLRLAKYREGAAAKTLVDQAQKIVAWTSSKLQDKDGLFDDRLVVATGEVKQGKLTYNTALMLRAVLGLYRATGEQKYLDEAKRIGKAADWFLDSSTGAYRDAVRYSHFMVEADLELYRATGEDYLLKRAKKNADAMYAKWKEKHPEDMISNAAVARVLWLVAESETDAGKAFWQKMDKASK